MTNIFNEPKLLDRLAFKILIRSLCGSTFITLFFLVAGRLDWIRGWAYVGLLTVGQTASAIYIWRRDPELLTMRSKIGKGSKKWDKILLGLFGITYLGILITSALDVRYSWSTMSRLLWPVGSVLYAFFIVIITWAMDVNRFFEKTVRIQTDRGHHVIDSGPYRFVRHPGYIATILGFILAAPLLLGSWWAFIPAFLSFACILIRTILEDRTLQMELPGYKEYTKRVRYRLLPRIW